MDYLQSVGTTPFFFWLTIGLAFGIPLLGGLIGLCIGGPTGGGSGLIIGILLLIPLVMVRTFVLQSTEIPTNAKIDNVSLVYHRDASQVTDIKYDDNEQFTTLSQKIKWGKKDIIKSQLQKDADNQHFVENDKVSAYITFNGDGTAVWHVTKLERFQPDGQYHDINPTER